MPPPKVDSKQF